MVNRVQYLVQKGAILRKGQRIKTKFCKFSHNPQGESLSRLLHPLIVDVISFLRFAAPSPPLRLFNLFHLWTGSVGKTDRIFVAVLYTSDADKVMRYTDEGAMQELCKWSVDLGMLPSFQMHASMYNGNGFYTEFELGLELDSAGTPRLVEKFPPSTLQLMFRNF